MIKQINIREMKKDDIRQVCAIENEVFSLPWSENAFMISLEQKHTLYLVAEEINTNQIVGYCGFYRSFEEADITNVAVEPGYRRQHIAEKMLEKLMESGKKLGIERFTLEVRKSNQPAIILYMHLGFESAGIRKNFYEKPIEDAVIMWKYR